ncbi:hypothetical protein HDU80_005835 [Chytriomyces hyalinus]|nr:hypothetical protein HDU80_005835 [Chytriomyces hyalinus]
MTRSAFCGQSAFFESDRHSIDLRSVSDNALIATLDVEARLGLDARLHLAASAIVNGVRILLLAINHPSTGLSYHMLDPATGALVQLKSNLLPKKGNLTMMQLSDSFGGSSWLVIQAKDLSILRLGWGPDGEIFVEKESIQYDRNLPKQISCVAFHTLETKFPHLGPFIIYGTSNNEVGLLKLADDTLERIPIAGLKNQGSSGFHLLKVQDQITNSCSSSDPVTFIEFSLSDDTLTIFAGCGSDNGCIASLESEDTLAFRRILKSAFGTFATDSNAIRSKVETRRLGRELAFDDIAANAGFSGPAMYPPENASNLFKVMEHAILTSDSGADSACAFIYYLLKDMNESCSLEFSKQFGMTTGLREAVDGLWYLDSGDFERAVMYLTSPGNNNLFRNETKVVRILLLNQQQVLASEYMEHCASYFKSADLVEMQLKMQLEDGGVNGAFMCQKAESERGNMQPLTLMLNAAFQSQTSESLLTCAFSDAEEQTLIEFCDKHAHEPVCIDFLFKYYLQRGRLAEAVSWIESNRVNMNGNDVDAELVAKIENLKLVLPESQLELIRHGNQAPDEISNEDRKDVAPASHLITALLDRCVEKESSETDMEDVDMFRSAVASPVIPAPETPVGRGTGTATPNKKDHTRVASPFMKRALTPTRATEFVDFLFFVSPQPYSPFEFRNTPTVSEMLSEHARQRSASVKKTSTPLATDGKPSNMFLEKPKSQNTAAMVVIKSPVGTPTTAHAMPLMNMSPFSSKKSVAFAVEPIPVEEPTPAPFDDYEEPLKASTRQYRKTPARATRKSLAATSERKNLVDEEDSENNSAIAVAATPSYSLRATRARLAAPTPSLLSEAPTHTTKTKPTAAAKTPKPKKTAAASATPAAMQKASSTLSDDPMTLDELLGTSETPVTAKRGASRAKSAVNKAVAAVAASAVETPRRSSRRIAKIVE